MAAAIVMELWEGFLSYIEAFEEITSGASDRFARGDWQGMQAKGIERLSLYKRKVGQATRRVRRIMKEDHASYEHWISARKQFGALAASHSAFEIAETFYNSVCRKVHAPIGADPILMFVLKEERPDPYQSPVPIFHTYQGHKSLEALMRQILHDYPFKVPFEDVERDIKLIADRIQEEVWPLHRPSSSTRVEMLKSVFYRNKGAYLVGRIHINGQVIPLVVPLLKGKGGLYADTVITDPDQVSLIFSFTRSYFQVQVAGPSEMVDFLRSIMPLKPYADLYNSIGFNKHGKTELYRDFVRHLEQSEDQFDFAPGTKGLVMLVFTLPSYHTVFKLIRDKAHPPKKTDNSMVRRKYRLVARHDRVGRMADTHEFEYFAFPKARFSPDLLKALQEETPSLVEIKEDTVILRHLYTERKMTPLNLFLKRATQAEIEEVVDEYGQTIRQLASVNIFPGDMLLKNFGLTRHQRVVFYDYDEIGFLTEYNFREMPKAQSPEEVYAAGPWFAVGPKDVFPEEFRHFLIGFSGMEEIFVKLHADLFTVEFWLEMQARQVRGEIMDIFPYREKKRFIHQPSAD